MLFLRRRDGERIIVTHIPSGDTFEIEQKWTRGGTTKHAVYADTEKFDIARPDMKKKKPVDGERSGD